MFRVPECGNCGSDNISGYFDETSQRPVYQCNGCGHDN
jgi:DNA-directed RNA polymerase subunit RPC12/RpoP